MSLSEAARPSLDIAILGTRGVPANYGGFETFAQELSTRLVRRGHRVSVYGRSHYVDPTLRLYQGVRIEVHGCLRTKYLETVSHTAWSVCRSLKRSHQVLLICNAANAFLSWIPRIRGKKVVLNVDGIERRRRKWGWPGRLFYQLSEFLVQVCPNAVVTDARTIQDYYLRRYGMATHFIPYGAPVRREESRHTLSRLGLEAGSYILYVSRLEPENNADLVIRAHRRADLPVPLVIVGDAPYNRRYLRHLRELAAGGRVLLPGAIYGQGYWELLSHCLCYVHATEVGGTHPALIEAMGAGCVVVVNDTPENREVLGEAGLLYPFNREEDLAELLRRVCDRPGDYRGLGLKAQERVRIHYDWERVVDRYEELFQQLAGGGK